jgi:tRNA(Ile2) C34 agmatinyltransferase TiaS
VELPELEKAVSALPVTKLQESIRPAIENCPRCNGQTELNGDGRLACHFCGNVFQPKIADVPVAA